MAAPYFSHANRIVKAWILRAGTEYPCLCQAIAIPFTELVKNSLREEKLGIVEFHNT